MHEWQLVVLVVAEVVLLAARADNLIPPPPCESDVYCKGDLLKTVQLVEPRLYNDSKTFVDFKQKFTYNVTLARFNELMARTDRNPSRDEIKQFVNENFEEGNELEEVEPQDWTATPSVLNRISDTRLKEWASHLNGLWRNLTRRVNMDVKLNSDKYSLLYVPNPFVVPGGRFKEPYYWDTYWIVRGLLLCDMKTTVKGILENFLYMQENYGIIPNGGRVYYLQRSQPPLLTPMVANYYVSTNDLKFVEDNIGVLEKEFEFWMNNRTVQVTKNGKTYIMARYFSFASGPRPESFREDYHNAQKLETDDKRREFYIDIKSAAESGWDFSSRWFNEDGSYEDKLLNIDTRNVVPVDLNSFIFWNAQLLSKLFEALGNNFKSQEYARVASQWKVAVNEVLWDETEGSWFDYDIRNKALRKNFHPSNFAPLWTRCYDRANIATIAEKVVNYMNKKKIASYLGGVPTSLDQTGEQWDYPIAWPPLQSIIIQGLQTTGVSSAITLAYRLAETWVQANYKGYSETGDMFERYSSNIPGDRGSGGEYTVQAGFGWTNGVILDLLSHYGSVLTATTLSDSNARRRSLELMDVLSPH